jgi:ribosomal protection tetracycline resistance protein
MNVVNIGIIAHVDAGKTSLTERILFETHVIDEIGRVDQGSTQTDSLELERRRGITIKASVVSFVINDLKINLIDTPGHADFVAEVERSFSVLDGAVLVISAVEGIQAQTKFLMATLARLGIPTIIFVNKIDRMGAQSASLVRRIKETLTPTVLALYRSEEIGGKGAFIVERTFDQERDRAFWEECFELVALNDDGLLKAYLDEEHVTEARMRAALTRQVRLGQVYPIFFGSAMTGVGVAELLAGVATFFPANMPDDDMVLSAVVFKLEKDDAGEKVAYVRIYAGSIQVRAHVPVSRRTRAGELETRMGKVKKLHLFQQGKSVQVPRVGAGEFCKVWGLEDVRIGDIVGEWSERIKELHLVTPQMETRIEARRPEQGHELFRALTELAEEDPLINIIRDPLHHEMYLRLFGEVQKEVVEATLQESYGLAVRFSETRVVCIEKPVGVGQALEEMGIGENPFSATVGLRVEPGSPGSGITYRLEVKLGALLLSFHKAIEETVFETLKQGLYGWEVSDIVVVLTHTGYSSVTSTAGDFRKLTPLVLMDALKRAGTAVYEPLNRFELNVPMRAVSQAMFKLSALHADFEQPVLHGDAFELKGLLPVATTEEFRRTLYSFSEGEGVLLTMPGGYREVKDSFPTRERTDHNPLNRKDYMLHILHTY